jgi:ubiquitin-conjugating enzyme E2 J1
MNQKNPAIKRILADVKELNKHPSSRYSAAPLETNMFEWHFTIRGPSDSAFEGGMYHGRILLPSEYPFKPPNIVFLTVLGSKYYFHFVILHIFAIEKWSF